MAAPTVELLWWRGCPSWKEAIALACEQMAGAGLDPDLLEVIEIKDVEQAEREDFVGSPTIRVNGRDLLPDGDMAPGLTCRVYRLRDGRPSPLPDSLDVQEGLLAAVEEGTE